MSIIAKRLDNIIPKFIDLDQTGFIRQRETQDSIRRTLHVIHHIKKNNIEAVLMGLDAEKAFHSVRWSFLYKVLNKFGFHHSIINALRSIYKNPKAKIKVNGSLSKPFILQRSC